MALQETGAISIDDIRTEFEATSGTLSDYYRGGGIVPETASEVAGVSFSVSSQDDVPFGIAFKPDGTKMYMVGNINDSVHQYSLSTAYDLSTASYDNISFSVQSQDGTPRDIAFKPDGTKMYMVGSGNESIYQYTLLTAYDLSTASYDNISFDVSSQDGGAYSIAFKPDGTKMYMLGGYNESVYQYSLSTAYDLSTASYDNISFSVQSQDGNPFGITFKPDGTKMYMVGFSNDSVHQYTLSTAYDLSTASYDNISFDVGSQDGAPSGITFKPDGTKMYMVGSGNDSVHQYNLSTAYDLSTASFETYTLPTSGTISLSDFYGLEYVIPWIGGDINTASYDNISFDVSSQDIYPEGIAFNTDGTKMYMVGRSSDSVYQYSLSTAYDLSTASYDNISFSVFSQDGSPASIAFKSDGTKMYMVGYGSISVYQYTLSTAYDLSTASYDNISFSVSQDNSLRGIAFKPDGTKMYVMGDINDSVHQYSLSTAYDLSTASYDNISLNVEYRDTSPAGIAFKPDGTKMYMVGNRNESIYQYTLLTAYDLSTASYDNISFDVSSQDGNPRDIAFKSDGTKMYMIGNGNDSVYQYSL